MAHGRAMVPIILLIASCALALGLWKWRQYVHVYHLATVRDGILYRDGVRSVVEFEVAVRKASPRTIVSLVDDREIVQEPFVGEMDYCRSKGIEVVRIPIPLGGWPTTGQVQQFLNIVADPARCPVLVHCAQGVRRTGMMVAAYQESAMNFDRERAKSALLAFGHSQRTIGDIERFIDIYDPVERRVTEVLPMSTE
jgi:protein tyrosine phosphatase (PTP) superfamily phosphohydrolase (DUF442 family)